VAEDYVSLFYLSSAAPTRFRWYCAVSVLLLLDVVAATMTLFKNARGNLSFPVALGLFIVLSAATAGALFCPRLLRRLARRRVALGYREKALRNGTSLCVEGTASSRIGGKSYLLSWDSFSVREDRWSNHLLQGLRRKMLISSETSRFRSGNHAGTALTKG
jgi:hypothetical protein